MYRFHHRQNHTRLWYIALGSVVIVVGLGTYIPRLLQPRTHISESPPIIRTVSAAVGQSRMVSNANYTVELPSDWMAATPPNTPYTVTSWQGAAKSVDTARRLDVYIDRVPTTFAANRLLPVQVLGERLEPIGYPSDNCVNFTDRTSTSAVTGTASSKWSGMNFMCDVGNYERDVVVIGSDQGLNTVTLTSPSGSPRRVMLVYTDNSASPDYSIFTAMVRSFRVRS